MKRIFNTLKEKWPEYLLEILVLIIGIYGAFAVESWNDDRKEFDKQKDLLSSIRRDLVEGKKELDNMIKINEENVSQLESLYSKVKLSEPYHYSMDTAFGRIIVWRSPFLKSTSYESMKTYGIEFIINQRLKESIIDIYEIHFPQIVEDYDKSEWTIAQSVSYPFFINRLERKSRIATPLEYEEMIAEPAFIANLSHIISLRKGGITMAKQANKKIQSTISLIDKEIQ